MDEDGKLDGRVDIQDLALAEPQQILARIARKIPDAVQDTAPRDEVVEKCNRNPLWTFRPW